MPSAGKLGTTSRALLVSSLTSKRLLRLVFAGAALFFTGCGSGSGNSPGECGEGALCGGGTLSYDFADGAQEWSAGFADYPAGAEVFYELRSGIAPLPQELGLQSSGFFIPGINHSDDLFMFLSRRLPGFTPGGCYRLEFVVEFATNAPADCVGVGGAPGEHVTLKAGAAGIAPAAAADENGFLRMNIDKGNQGQGGADALPLGHIGNSKPCPSDVYEFKTLSGSQQAAADAGGQLWLIVGTDSGFEGRTSLYYRRIQVTVSGSGAC